MNMFEQGQRATKGLFITLFTASIPSWSMHTSCTRRILSPKGAGWAFSSLSMKYWSEDPPVTGGTLIPAAFLLSHMGPRPNRIISSSSSLSSEWNERKPVLRPSADTAVSSSGLIV